MSQFDATTGTGPSALAVAKEPEKYNAKYVLLEADLLNPEEIVSLISKKLGKKGHVQYADPKEFAKSFPGAHELAEMVRWFDEYGYYGPETEVRKHGSGKKYGDSSFVDWRSTSG